MHGLEKLYQQSGLIHMTLVSRRVVNKLVSSMAFADQRDMERWLV